MRRIATLLTVGTFTLAACGGGSVDVTANPTTTTEPSAETP